MAAIEVERTVEHLRDRRQRGPCEIGNLRLLHTERIAVAIAGRVGRQHTPSARRKRPHERFELLGGARRWMDHDEGNALPRTSKPIMDLPAGDIGESAPDWVRHALTLPP